ncbi:MAG: response regulator, partial [Bacteroidota bacterium]
MKILIVDDEKSIQRLYQQRFRKEIRSGQIELSFAFSGEEALDFLEGGGVNKLTMILSDINMPKMSGLELLKRVRV